MTTRTVRKLSQPSKRMSKPTLYIYMIHTVVPSYHHTLKGAVAHVWATHARPFRTEGLSETEVHIAYNKHELARMLYLNTATMEVRARGVFSPHWRSEFPQVKITREELHP